VITEQGIAALRRARPSYAQGISRYFAQWLTPEHTQALLSALERIEESFNQPQELHARLAFSPKDTSQDG
jgi:hypothetical protein